MTNESQRGGMKKGGTRGPERKQHQGVRPGSTTQNKAQRQKQAEKRFDKRTRVINDQ